MFIEADVTKILGSSVFFKVDKADVSDENGKLSNKAMFFLQRHVAEAIRLTMSEFDWEEEPNSFEIVGIKPVEEKEARQYNVYDIANQKEL